VASLERTGVHRRVRLVAVVSAAAGADTERVAVVVEAAAAVHRLAALVDAAEAVGAIGRGGTGPQAGGDPGVERRTGEAGGAVGRAGADVADRPRQGRPTAAGSAGRLAAAGTTAR